MNHNPFWLAGWRAALEQAKNAQCWMCREGQPVEPKGGRFVHPDPYGEGVTSDGWKWCDASPIRSLEISTSSPEPSASPATPATDKGEKS